MPYLCDVVYFYILPTWPFHSTDISYKFLMLEVSFLILFSFKLFKPFLGIQRKLATYLEDKNGIKEAET